MLLRTTRKPFLTVLISTLALLASSGLAAIGVQSAQAAQAAQEALASRDAFAVFKPASGGPANGGTVSTGQKFTLDLYVNSGANPDVTGAQNYLKFDNSVVQVVDAAGTSCTPASTVPADNSKFDVVLQNQICNGPGQCNFTGLVADAGTIAFASGALTRPATGGEFRVASITFCAVNGGDANIRWEFASRGAPINRDTQIIVTSSELVQNPSAYRDYSIRVSGPTATPNSNPPTRIPTPGPPRATNPPARTAQPQATACSMNFRDVQASDTYYTSIQSMYCKRVISGYNDNTFRPYETTLRAQLAKMVVLAFGFETNTVGAPHFTDVGRDNQFFNYIETAYSRGIISGYEGKLFKPWDNLKRGQVAKMIVLAAGQADPNGWRLENPSTPSFRDVAASSEFYKYVETAKAHQVLGGFEDNTFRLFDFAKRGQICKILDGTIQSR